MKGDTELIKTLIAEKKFIIVSERYPGNLYPEYLQSEYVCELCSGFHKGTQIKKNSIASHYRLYHEKEAKQ